MYYVYSQEKFKEMLKEKGLKVTNQRLLVLQVLAEHGDEHMTAEDIFELVKEDYPEIGLATIYRTVQLLLDMQLVDRIMLDDGCVRYEIGDFLDEQEGHRHHHHHLICTECGNVSAFRDDLLEDLEAYIEKETGFQVTDHELNFTACAENAVKKKNNGKINLWRCKLEERKQWKIAYHSAGRSGEDWNEHYCL